MPKREAMVSEQNIETFSGNGICGTNRFHPNYENL
jgi:hypothetical protein